MMSGPSRPPCQYCAPTSCTCPSIKITPQRTVIVQTPVTNNFFTAIPLFSMVITQAIDFPNVTETALAPYAAPPTTDFFNNFLDVFDATTGIFRPPTPGYYLIDGQFNVTLFRSTVSADTEALNARLQLQKSIDNGVTFPTSIFLVINQGFLPPNPAVQTWALSFPLSYNTVIKVDDTLGGNLAYRWTMVATFPAGVTGQLVTPFPDGSQPNIFTVTRIADL